MSFGVKTHSAPISHKRGVLVSSPLDSDKKKECEFVQCCHCQRLWLYKPGSGKVRGFCLRCMGVTCGPDCDECVPAMQMIENMEAGMPWEQARKHRPIKASVPGIIPGR